MLGEAPIRAALSKDSGASKKGNGLLWSVCLAVASCRRAVSCHSLETRLCDSPAMTRP